MTLTSSWICPACAKRNMFTDKDAFDLIMRCVCPNCSCKFFVDVWSTDAENDEN